MIRRIASFAVTALLALSSFSLLVTILPDNARASTLFVGGSGPGNYTTIQEAVDAANAGDTVYVYSGLYQEDVEVPKPLSLVGEDPISTLIEIPGAGANLVVTSDWVNITGFSFTNMMPPSGNNWGIFLDAADHCSIINNNIFQNSMEGIVLSSSNNNLVADNVFRENKGGGIALGDSDHNRIVNNTLIRNGPAQLTVLGSQFNIVSLNTVTSDGPTTSGIHLQYADDSIVVENNLTDMYQGVSLYGSNKISVVDNSIVNMVEGIYLSVSRLNVLRDNVMTESGIFFQLGDVADWNSHEIDTSNTVNGRPVYYWKNVTGGTVPSGAGQVILANCTNVVVENQNISNGTEGVTLGFSFNNTIRNNNVSSHHYNGIRTYESEYNWIGGNTAFDNTKGIFLESTANTSVSGNTVLSNEAGISLFGARENTLLHNEVRLDFNGIFIDLSMYNWITNNSIFENSVGISFDRSHHNTINNNTISENFEGVYLTYSDNMVYHNSFINNTNQAIDSALFGYNIWDNGYPSGGNFWSDYNGIDVMMGPRQDIPGTDGIGDTPRDVPNDSKDRYPLLYPMEFGRPRPPTVEYAILSGTSYRDVVVGWDLSPDDGGGLNSIVGYDVYRNTSYDPFFSGYQFVASVPSGSVQFVDSQAGEGNPSNYFYIVCAVNITGTSSCSSNQAGKFTRTLMEGPNLVSIPLIQSDESIGQVFQTVRFDEAWTYAAHQNGWTSFVTLKPYKGELQTIDHMTGVWINVTESSNLTVAGIVPWTTSIKLVQGWNLVGFPSFDPNCRVGDVKAATNALRIEGFDDSSPPYFLRLCSDIEMFGTGYGYWMLSESSTDWDVPVF